MGRFSFPIFKCNDVKVAKALTDDQLVRSNVNKCCDVGLLHRNLACLLPGVECEQLDETTVTGECQAFTLLRIGNLVDLQASCVKHLYESPIGGVVYRDLANC